MANSMSHLKLQIYDGLCTGRSGLNPVERHGYHPHQLFAFEAIASLVNTVKRLLYLCASKVGSKLVLATHIFSDNTTLLTVPSCRQCHAHQCKAKTVHITYHT